MALDDGSGSTMGRFRRVAAAAAMVSTVMLLAVQPASASDMVNYETQYATDVAVFGLGALRGTDSGTMTVSGVSGTVTKAFLYWAGPAQTTTDENVNAAITVNGTDVTGTSLGFTDNNCWGFASSIAYRADVTSIVSGNGALSLTNIRNASPSADVNGFSLYVFYDDGNVANNRDVVIFNGNDSNIANEFDALGWNATLPGINYSSGDASLHMTFSDTQIFTDDDFLVNGQVVADPVETLNGSTVEQGAGSPPLWDNKTYAITSLLTPGDNTVTLTGGGAADCVSLIVAGVDLPAGAAPNQPSTTTTEAPTTTAAAVGGQQVAAPVAPRFTG